MSAFFGRRHSISGHLPAQDDSLPRYPRRRRASAPNIQDVVENGLQTKIRDFFRRRRESSPVRNGASVVAGIENIARESSHPGSEPRKSHVGVHTRQDSGVHVQSTQSDAEPRSKPHRNSEYQLTRKDAKVIFSGAPYFLLEKGKQDQWYPHVLFPFDDHDPTIQCLWDRQDLPYASYTLCTLHAHLPIRDNWIIKGEPPIHRDSSKLTEPPKRASFDAGMFEVPNMLSMNGKEPGSVGFHYFLEMPVADSLRFTGPLPTSAHADFVRLSSLPATQAFELMEHHNDPYALCGDGAVHDRKKLLLDGPVSWKRIGVRDVGLRDLVERLQTLKDIRYDILHGKQAKTILDFENPRELCSGLFTKFLYPPSRFMLSKGEESVSLQCQIKALTLVLATRGAWLDFSMAEWRLRIGQVLWEAPPHAEGDFLDPPTSDRPWAHLSIERRWFFVQMVLAAELLLRLDATVRIGLLQNSHGLEISARDIHDFDQLRNAKVNWDMIAVRRFMDSFTFTYNPEQPDLLQSTRSAPVSKEPERRPRHSFFETLAHRPQSPVTKASDYESVWRCNLSPQFVDQQLQGLFVFAENIGWPQMDDLKRRFQSVLGNGNSQQVDEAYNRPIRNAALAGVKKDRTKNTTYSKTMSYRPLLLQPTHSNDTTTSSINGWITRTWLSGLVLPGEAISQLLMASILENDADAVALLGPVMNLHGGFSYRGRSWWSKECIVGLVLSCLRDTQICMGWMGSSVLPKDSQTMEPLENTWFEVSVKEPQVVPGKPRIQQGNRLSIESTPLGVGDLTSGAFSLPVDCTDGQDSELSISFKALVFDVKNQAREEFHPPVAETASVAFSLASNGKKGHETVIFPLAYNVRFISSHECRPPGGLISYCAPATTGESGGSSASSSPGPRKHQPRLPGHPLHRSYAYKMIALDSLPDVVEPERYAVRQAAVGVASEVLSLHEIMVLDARGSTEKEAFARAWCASVGYHAILGRVGRTCLACCIREARALNVKVVIRIGEGSPSSKMKPQSETCLKQEE